MNITTKSIAIGSDAYAEAHDKLTHEFTGDSLAADVCMSKYLHHDSEHLHETSLADMHNRWVNEFDRIEESFERSTGVRCLTKDRIAYLLQPFKRFVLGGSPMSGIGLGNFTSMSNCYVIGNDADSYGGIFKTDEEQVQLMKRRGGVGHDLSHIRPEGVEVHNSALTTSGVVSFMERFSNSTKEVAQNGRRGALMLSLSITHPDADKFIDAKQDLTKVTGANISIKLTDAFMRAVVAEQDFEQHWVGPQGQELKKTANAKALFDKIVNNAWATAEPGVFFWDRILNESNAAVYGKEWTEVCTNPCFTGDTLVAVADGRNAVRIDELASTKQPFLVYSAKQNKRNKKASLTGSAWKAEIKQAVAFCTGTKHVIKAYLSDGSSFTCTPDHRLATADGSYVEAQNAIGITLAKFFTFTNIYNSKSYRTINSIDNAKENIYLTEPVCITHIEDLGECKVYDLSVEDNHNFYIITKTADDKYLNCSGILVHNCGEIPLYTYGSCILAHRNLTAYVINPWSSDASFDFESFYKDTYDCAILMDDIVELEIEAVKRIQSKIASDVESEDIKRTESELWNKIYNKLVNARRYGMGFLALGDTFAMLGLKYGSQESIEFATTMQQWLVKATYEASIDLAKIRGAFGIFDYDKDVKSAFVQRMLSELIDDEHIKTYQQYGRRNINTTTIAPTGTTALMTQTTSGIEPVFMPLHKRRRKPTSVDKESDVNFVDPITGDKFIEYIVVHYPLMQWICKRVKLNDDHSFTIVKDTNIAWSENEMHRIKQWLSTASQDVLNTLFTESPYFESTTEDVDWIGKVKLQGALQKWIDSSISVTINIPNAATKELVKEIYMTAWQSGCKGCTIYRDGSRTGVLVKDTKDKAKDKLHTLKSGHRSKRKPVLPAAVYCVSVYQRKWCILIGCDNGKPYEVFAFELSKDEFDKLQNVTETTITKTDKKHYMLGENCQFIEHYDNISERLGSDEQQTITRLYSTMLRNDVDLAEIVDQTAKSFASVGTFCKAIGRALKLHIKDGSKMYAKCPECGGSMVKFDGCVKCTECGYSACNQHNTVKFCCNFAIEHDILA